MRRHRRWIVGITSCAVALVVVLGAGALFGLPTLSEKSSSEGGEPGPRQVVTAGEGWEAIGWAERDGSDGPACMALRVGGQEVAGQCGYRETPEQPGYSPSVGRLPDGRQVVFGPVPANIATAVLALPDGQRRPVPTESVRDLPGRFFAVAVSAAPPDVPVQLLDAEGQDIAV